VSSPQQNNASRKAKTVPLVFDGVVAGLGGFSVTSLSSPDVLSVATVFDMETVFKDSPDAAACFGDTPNAKCFCFKIFNSPSLKSVDTSHEKFVDPVVDNDNGSKEKSDSSDLSKTSGFFQLGPPVGVGDGDNLKRLDESVFFRGMRILSTL
jgi:hypothetical protein